MENGYSGLSLDALRRANMARLPQFKNARGEPAHSEPDGSDWGLAQWCNAVCGELGELANLIKKVERGDFTLAEAREAIGKEGADVLTYLDILMFRAGVDLGRATIDKFNEVSERVGSSVSLTFTGAAIMEAPPGDDDAWLPRIGERVRLRSHPQVAGVIISISEVTRRPRVEFDDALLGTGYYSRKELAPVVAS